MSQVPRCGRRLTNWWRTAPPPTVNAMQREEFTSGVRTAELSVVPATEQVEVRRQQQLRTLRKLLHRAAELDPQEQHDLAR